MRRLPPLALGVLLALLVLVPPPARAADPFDRRAVEALAERWFAARPPTRFASWDAERRRALLAEAEALGALPEGQLERVRDLLWKAVRKHAPKPRESIDTPYGPATWIQKGRGGPRDGLLLGLHGGGEGAGDASEAAGNWSMPGCMAMYPQGIRLVHDTWNTVHGEAFLLTLIEIAKARYEIDPDRVYVVGFSMGGTGSWHLAGRHPDLLAGAIPAHGVLMAAPKSQLWKPEEVQTLQHGLVPNVRNLAVWFYTGLADDHCMPGTFLYADDLIRQLRGLDPGGYAEVRFASYEGIAHTFPPGEPSRGLAWIREKRRDAFPRRIAWEHASDPFPLPTADDPIGRPPQRWMYWLHCARPLDGMTVTATRDGNDFDLEISGADAEDFTVWMNPSMIDPGADVVVRVGGREVWRGRPVPTVAAVLESLDARLDRTLCFDRCVHVPAPVEAPRSGG